MPPTAKFLYFTAHASGRGTYTASYSGTGTIAGGDRLKVVTVTDTSLADVDEPRENVHLRADGSMSKRINDDSNRMVSIYETLRVDTNAAERGKGQLQRN